MLLEVIKIVLFVGVLKSLFNFFWGSDKPNEQQEPRLRQPQYRSQHRDQLRLHQYSSGPSSAPASPLPLKKHEFQDLVQVDQSADFHVSLREQAIEHGESHMVECFQKSKEAYNRGDGALAKQLSNQGKEHQKMLNKEASEWVFRKNNENRQPGEIDLHGLHVKEAVARVDEAITNAEREGRSDLRFIVGKGLHSKDGDAKIKPAIEALMQQHRFKAEFDPQNSGVLVVRRR